MDQGRLTELSLNVTRANGPLRRVLDAGEIRGGDRRTLDRTARMLEDVAWAIDQWAQLRSSRVWLPSTLSILVGICTNMFAGDIKASDVAGRMRDVASQLRGDVAALDAATIQELIKWNGGLSDGITKSQSAVPCVTMQMGDGFS